ncbi:hypothetical protein D3C85_594820 [compost metagenome]
MLKGACLQQAHQLGNAAAGGDLHGRHLRLPFNHPHQVLRVAAKDQYLPQVMGQGCGRRLRRGPVR